MQHLNTNEKYESKRYGTKVVGGYPQRYKQ